MISLSHVNKMAHSMSCTSSPLCPMEYAVADTREQTPSLADIVDITIQDVIVSLISAGSLPPFAYTQTAQAAELVRRLTPVPARPADGESVVDWATRRFQNEILKALALAGIAADDTPLTLEPVTSFFRDEIAPRFAQMPAAAFSASLSEADHPWIRDPAYLAAKAQMDAAQAYLDSMGIHRNGDGSYTHMQTTAAARGTLGGLPTAARAKAKAKRQNKKQQQQQQRQLVAEDKEKSAEQAGCDAPTNQDNIPPPRRGPQTPPPPVPFDYSNGQQPSCTAHPLAAAAGLVHDSQHHCGAGDGDEPPLSATEHAYFARRVEVMSFEQRSCLWLMFHAYVQLRGQQLQQRLDDAVRLEQLIEAAKQLTTNEPSTEVNASEVASREAAGENAKVT